jgi:hypothetical protein
MVMMLGFIVDVVEVDFRVTDRVPGIPGDLQDHEGDPEADHRVENRRAKPGSDRAADHRQRDEAIDPRVVSVRDERRTAEPSPTAQTHACGDLVADEADDARGGEHSEVAQVLRMNEASDRLDKRDSRRHSDRQHDEQAGDLLAPCAAQEEGDTKWHGGECVAEVMDHVREQRDRPGNNEDEQLHDRRDPENSKRDRDRLQAFAGAQDRAVDQAVRMTVIESLAIAIVIAMVREVIVIVREVIVIVLGSGVVLVLANVQALCSCRSTSPRRRCSTWKTAWSSRSATCES